MRKLMALALTLGFALPAFCGSTLAPDVAVAGLAAGAVAPDADNFMWQGIQTDFVDSSGRACSGRVTIGMGDQATCFTAADGELLCAGRIYTHDYGPSFVAAGVSDVEQVFISSTWNSENGNSMCIKKSDGTVHCLGALNDWGVFGDGTTSPSSSFVQWGHASNNVRIGTGTWTQLCAIDSTGVVSCTGSQPWIDAGGARRRGAPLYLLDR